MSGHERRWSQDVDRFITADRGLFRGVGKLETEARFPVASCVLAGADTITVAQILEAVARAPARNDK